MEHSCVPLYIIILHHLLWFKDVKNDLYILPLMKSFSVEWNHGKNVECIWGENTELKSCSPTEMDTKCMDVALSRHVEAESVGAGNILFKNKILSLNILTLMEGIKDYTNMPQHIILQNKILSRVVNLLTICC